MSKSFLNNNTLARGLRNNNPGNIRVSSSAWYGKIPYTNNKDWSGTPANVVRSFEQFNELRYGLRALMVLLNNYYFKNGLKTVRSIITKYAPAFENHTEAYINSVIDSVGSNAIPELTEDILIKLAKAIVKVENGNSFTSYVTDADYKEALAISGLRLKKK